jgi:2-polyprenyl-6-methoxyphenol hydroxylase-like FAD-dependent oxidoreductase
MTATTRRHAEIAGGGIAGLTMACALASKGWSVTLHERNAELREMGAALFLKVNSLMALKQLGLLEQARGLGMRLRRGQIHDERGTVLIDRILPDNEEALTMLRPDLHRLLAGCAQRWGVEVRTGSDVIGADPSGALRLRGGETRRADLVIAADGHRSPVRDSVGLTRALTALPEGAIRVLAPRNGDEREGISVEYWSGDCRVGIVPCNRDQLYLYLIGPESEEGVRSVPIDKRFWCERFPQVSDVIQRIPADAGRYDRLMMATVTGWYSGRVAIIGDAAHAQPPNLGQGAGMSMANAMWLAQELDAGGSVEDALKRWEEKRRPVSEAVQKWSYRYGLLGYGLPSKMQLLRSAFVWTLGHTGPTSRRWGWVWRGGYFSGEVSTMDDAALTSGSAAHAGSPPANVQGANSPAPPAGW